MNWQIPGNQKFTTTGQVGGFTDTKLVLLAHFDGTNSATAYTAQTGQIFTFNGSAQLSTAQKEFGTASLLLASATSDYVTIPGDTNHATKTDSYTKEMWVSFVTLPSATYTLLSRYHDSNHYWAMNVVKTGGNYYLQMSVMWGGIIRTVTSTALTIATGTWYHMVSARYAGVTKLFFNGTDVTDTVNSVENGYFPNFGDVLTIGALNGANFFNGYIDEVRVLRYAAYTTNFTVPTTAYKPMGVPVRVFSFYIMSSSGGASSAVYYDGVDTTTPYIQQNTSGASTDVLLDTHMGIRFPDGCYFAPGSNFGHGLVVYTEEQ